MSDAVMSEVAMRAGDVGCADPDVVASFLRRIGPVERPLLDAFLALGCSHGVEAGEVVCRPGVLADGLTLVRDGRLRLEQDGHFIKQFGGDEFFGEGALFRDEPPDVTITTLERCTLFIVPREAGRAFVRANTAFGFALASVMLVESLGRLSIMNRLYADNRALALENASLAKFVSESPAPVARVARDGRVLYANEAATGILRSWRTAVGAQLPLTRAAEVARAYDSGAPQDIEVTVDDHVFVLSLVPVPAGDYLNIYGRDATEERRKTAEINYIAKHDFLTGLANRQMFLDKLGEAFQVAGPERRGALLFLDLDHFKEVNDTLGHAIGDQLLQAVSRRLLRTARGNEVVARLGGDEFAIIHSTTASPNAVAAHAERIISVLSRTFSIEGNSIRIGVSIGATFFPEGGDTIEDVMRRADMAMYRAKNEGRNTFRLYTPALNAEASQRLQVEADLRAAVATGGIAVHFQPKISLVDGRLVGAEALARWSAAGRDIGPMEFLPVAERIGLMGELGMHVLRRAVDQARAWEAAGWGDLRLAVNLSAAQLQDAGLVEQVRGLLDAAGFAPERLEFEITESVMLDDVDTVVATLDALRGLGIGLSIDDFGTGFSSLSQLRRLQVDKMKIGHVFVRDAVDGGEAATLMRAVIGLGLALDVVVAADGIEDEAQFALLRQLGCQEGQGFYFSPALPPEAFLQYLEQEPHG